MMRLILIALLGWAGARILQENGGSASALIGRGNGRSAPRKGKSRASDRGSTAKAAH
jgi:hypothetical protein